MTAPSQAVERYTLNDFAHDVDGEHGGEYVRATDYDALTARVRELEAALKAIVALEHTENDEWDGVERVIPEMVALASAALAKATP